MPFTEQKTKRWYIKYPLDAYALGPIEVDRPTIDRRYVRRYVSEHYENGERLPRGFECWPAYH